TARALERRLRSYAKPSLLAVDEIGYLGYDAHAADLLFQVVSRRYEQRSLVVTTNLLRFRKRKRLNAQRIVTRSLAARDSAFRSSCRHFTPHNGAWGQRGNEFVGGLEPPGAQLRRHHGLQRFQFHRRIRARVDFRRLHVGVSEPQRDFPQIFGRLQYRERAGVSQQVREHALGRQRRASLPCGLGVLAQEVFDPGTRQMLVVRVDEELRDTHMASHGKPGSQGSDGGLPQRQTSLPPAFPSDQQVGLRLQREVIETQTDQFGDPEA